MHEIRRKIVKNTIVGVLLLLALALITPYSTNTAYSQNIVENITLIANLTLKTIKIFNKTSNIKIILLKISSNENTTTRITTNKSLNEKPNERKHTEKPYLVKREKYLKEIKLANILQRLYLIAKQLPSTQKIEIEKIIKELTLANKQSENSLNKIVKEIKKIIEEENTPKNVIQLLNTLYSLLTNNTLSNNNIENPQDKVKKQIKENNKTTMNILNISFNKKDGSQTLLQIIAEKDPRLYKILLKTLEALNKNNTYYLAVFAREIVNRKDQIALIAKYLVLLKLAEQKGLRKAIRILESYGITITIEDIETLKNIKIIPLSKLTYNIDLLEAIKELHQLKLVSKTSPLEKIPPLEELLNKLELYNKKSKNEDLSLQLQKRYIKGKLLGISQSRNTAEFTPIPSLLIIAIILLVSTLFATPLIKRLGVPITLSKPSGINQLLIGNKVSRESEIKRRELLRNTIIEVYWKATSILAQIVPRLESETHREYLQKTKTYLKNNIYTAYSKLTMLYEKTRYGKQKTNEKEALQLYEEIESIKEDTNNEK